jgi:alpha-mannosidase
MYLTMEKLERYVKDMENYIHTGAIEINDFKYFQGTAEGAQHVSYDDSSWQDFRIGESWGGYDKVAWFRKKFTIPKELRDKELSLRFIVGLRDGGGSTAETLLYINGIPTHGLDYWHDEVRITDKFKNASELSIALKAWSGVLEVPHKRRFVKAELLTVDKTTEKFYYLMKILYENAKELDENDLRKVEILKTLNQAVNKINFIKPKSEEFYKSVKEAYEFLSFSLEKFKNKLEIKPRVSVIGHAHIDMAWLWQLKHTTEKASRTFSTVLHLMERFPEYKFMQASPALYELIREKYPEIFTMIKERSSEGRWEITGGMWVEPDTNVPNGESLVRQILFGKRYMKEEFGVESTLLWLPDVFGYSWTLPQILKKSGIDYFFTNKMSWNQYNRFPYDTFRWRGLDGSEVTTQLGTTPEDGCWWNTYNGIIRPWDIKGTWDKYNQKNINDELLMVFGWGDGGGGPTKEMLEAYDVMRDLPGIPRVEMTGMEEYFHKLGKRLEDKDVPVWDGEMYLEYHRGNYTSQAYNKRANRKSEVLFHNVELISSIHDILSGEKNYRQRDINETWKTILLNQFHDIIPGSSVKGVYEDSTKDYGEIEKTGTEILNEAKNKLIDNIKLDKNSLVVFNTLSWDRDGVINVGWDESLKDKTLLVNGKKAPVQVVENNNEKQILIQVEGVSSMGYKAFEVADKDSSAAANELTVSTNYIENKYYKIKLNEKGQIESLFDKKTKREVIDKNQPANVLQAFEDKPKDFDAWNVDIYYQQKKQAVDDLINVRVEEAGPVRGAIRLQWKFYDSIITQRMIIYSNSPRIDFETEVDWKENQVLLKAAFPVEIRSTKATYDIQFGNVERATHWNTSWDYSKFENLAHKWVDLSEGNYGVSLLNDCKYGHDIKDNVIRITLIKSPISPNPDADKCMHYFTYCLLPHSGDWKEGEVSKAAYELNYPMFAQAPIALGEGCLPCEYKFAELDIDNAMIETVKKAEDGDAWVVRVYEYKQYRNPQAVLSFFNNVERAVECNLIEADEKVVNVEDNRITFELTPYEIKTFKVWFK